MRSKRRIIVLVAGAIIVAALAVLGFAQIQQPYQTSFSGSTHDSGTGGGLALWRWLQRLGWNVTLSDESLPAVPDLPSETGNCLLSLGNNRLDDGDASWQRLADWVAKGNSVFLVTS